MGTNGTGIVVLQPDLDTLEKLLRMEHPEVRLKITNGILETFATRHVKSVANSPAIAQLFTDMRELAERERKTILEQMGMKAGYSGRWEMPASIRDQIKDQVTEGIRLEVKRQLTTGEKDDDTRLTSELVRMEVESQTDRIKRLVADEVAQAVRKEVVRQVQEKVNAILQADPE